MDTHATLEDLLEWAADRDLEEALDADAFSVLRDGSRWDDDLRVLLHQSGSSVRQLLAYGDDLLSESSHRRMHKRLLRELRAYLEGAHRAQSGSSTSSMPTTYPQIIMWARGQGLGWCLDRKVNRPGRPHIHRAGSQTWNTFLGYLGWSSSSTDDVLVAAQAYFEEELAQHREALHRERTQPLSAAPLPPEEELHPLIERLRALHAEMVQEVAPPTRSLLDMIALRVESNHPLRMAALFSPETGLGGENAKVVLEYHRGSKELRPRVVGGAISREMMLLSAADRLQEYLLTGEGSFRSTIVNALTQSVWQLALGELDALAAKARAAASPPEGRVGWLLTTDLGRIKLTPQVEKVGKRGDHLSRRNVGWKSLRENPQWLREPADARVVELEGAFDKYKHVQGHLTVAQFRQMQALVGHPRVFFADREQPVRVEASTLAITAQQQEGSVWLRGLVGGQAHPASDLLRDLQWAEGGVGAVLLDEANGRVCVVTYTSHQRNALEVVAKYEEPIPRARAAEVVRRIPAWGGELGFTLSEDGLGREVAPELEILLQVEPVGNALDARLRVRAAPRSPLYAPGEGPKRVIALSEGDDLRWATRDLAGEEIRAAEVRAELGLDPASGWSWRGVPAEQALPVLQRARDISDLAVVWEGKRRWRVAGKVEAERLRIELEDVKDWFGISGMAQLDGEQLSIAALLQAIRRGEAFVPVAPDAWVEITASLRQQLVPLAASVRSDDRAQARIDVPLSALPALDGLLSAAELTQASERFARLRAAMTSSASIDPPAPALRADLRPYQIDGYRWLYRMQAWGLGCILADDMGLGKTVQALALLVQRSAEGAQGPALVVAPTSLGFNWAREIKRFAPQLQPVLYRGSRRHELLSDAGPEHVVITSYALMQRDIDRLQEHRFHTLVFDEAQALKNANTRRSRAARKLKADWRLGLTGTPLENHAGELWALFHVIEAGLLGSWEHFRKGLTGPWQERGAALAAAIRPFVLRRTKRQVAPELPSRTVINVPVQMSARERALYKEARLAVLAHLARATVDLPDEQKRFEVLAALTRLRQLACDPRLVKDIGPAQTSPSAKVAHAVSLMETVAQEGRAVLAFSQFTSLLDLVQHELTARDVSYLRLDGSTPAERREELVTAFQNGEAPVFLISLKAGGAGLNLTAADTVIHLDPWWNPAVEDQATDRTHRIGQTQPVTVYRLISRHTVEEEILRLHQSKRRVVEDLLEGTDRAATLSTEDLAALIRGHDERA